MGSSQHITVPAGYDAGISWNPARQTVVPLPDGRPTHVRAEDGFDLWDRDGTTSCTFTREGDTLTLTQAVAAGAPLGNPSPLDEAVSTAIDHAFTTNTTNTTNTVDRTSDGLSVTLGDVVLHLIKKT